ncbi:crossover junction endodeoxyribonuclease RuvC [Candidatus Woesebacteria bacterium]|nr:crossover junction endodeoxyribonuclease RuvC [Candidatus Woesebacteria bacterium]
MMILGIDPGYERLGWGVLNVSMGNYSYHACGVIQTPKSISHPERLEQLFTQLQSIFSAHNPSAMAIETLFFSKNEKTALLVAQARGIILLSARLANCPIDELSPSTIKSVVAGNGQSDKRGVEKMLRLQLKGIPTDLLDDTVDALAIAYTSAMLHR